MTFGFLDRYLLVAALPILSQLPPIRILLQLVDQVFVLALYCKLVLNLIRLYSFRWLETLTAQRAGFDAVHDV